MKSNSSGSPILVPSDELPVGTTEHRKTGTPFELARLGGNIDVLKLLDTEEENEAEKPDNLDKYLPFTINRDEVADMKKVVYEHLRVEIIVSLP
jgi:hypothetical protein